MVLGDFGAEIIKVESSPDGDPTRQTGTYFTSGQSTMFLTWNRNKRSLCLDLRSDRGIEVVRRLVGTADVLLENYRPGVADQIGIGWEDVRHINKRLVYCSVNAFGSKGPWAGRPGTDPVVQAFSGVMSVTGEPDGRPALVGVPIADFSSAMLTVQGVILALLARERSGEGQRVEVSMLGSLLFALTTRVGPFFLTGEDPGRFGSAHSQVVPYQAFEASDGYVVAGVWGDADWPAFCRAVDMPELADDERFDSNVKRVNRRPELTKFLDEQFRTASSDYWESRFGSEKVLFAPVNTFSKVFNHPQTIANDYVTTVQHPTVGELPLVAPVVKLSSTPATVEQAPPLLGEHSIDILRAADFSTDEIRSLIDDGVVHSHQAMGPAA
jgi:formyl-CoA transferase/CoA:oxalate CoA-transferase